MEYLSKEKASLAFKQRIRSQALCHLVGKSVERQVVMRFRKAGAWSGDISQEILPLLLPVLTQKDHSQRMDLSNGPLVVFLEGNNRWIIEVSEHLISHDIEVRKAALQHFIDAQLDEECWVSPYVLSLLEKNKEALAQDEESAWISAGLELRDAIEHDFHVNCAGVRQANEADLDKTNEMYFSKIIQPRAICFQHDRPEIGNPAKETEKIKAKICEWSQLDDLGIALNRYLEYCGYLPLARELSSASLISAWKEKHSDQNIWESLWNWVESSPSVLAEYHVAQTFLEHPHWIRQDKTNRLLDAVRGIISSPMADSKYEQSPLWRLRSYLLRHYQLHLEAMAPGLDSELVAVSACWMAEKVSQLMCTGPEHALKQCEYISSNLLPISLQKNQLAKSRMVPSSLQMANRYSQSIWSDSLLATAVRRLEVFPNSDYSDDYRESLTKSVNSAIYTGSLRVIEKGPIIYAFEDPISPLDLKIPESPTKDETVKFARQILSARLAIEGPNGLKELLSVIPETPDDYTTFFCEALRAWLIDRIDIDLIMREFLTDNDFRQKVFHYLPLSSLEMLFSFLIDWQLQQNDEWVIRVPEILSYECENSQDPERRETLLVATFFSTISCGIVSPVTKLLVGSKRTELSPLIKNMCENASQIGGNSEPWLASRIRGFIGTIENAM